MEHFDLAIIGTGSGNTIRSTSTPLRRKRVAICEQGIFGGTCLNVGCIPTKMFVYAAEVAQTIRRAAALRRRRPHRQGALGRHRVRVFGRIDPIAAGGEQYRASLPNVDVYASHARFAGTSPTAGTRCAPTTATSSPPTRS